MPAPIGVFFLSKYFYIKLPTRLPAHTTQSFDSSCTRVSDQPACCIFHFRVLFHNQVAVPHYHHPHSLTVFMHRYHSFKLRFPRSRQRPSVASSPSTSTSSYQSDYRLIPSSLSTIVAPGSLISQHVVFSTFEYSHN